MKCTACNRSLPVGSLYCRFCGARQDSPAQPVTPTRYKKNPNGSGYAYKRGNTWTVRYRRYAGLPPVNGNAQCVEHTKGGFATKAEAKAYLSALQVATKKEVSFTIAYYWSVIQRDTLPQMARSKQTNYTTAYNRLKPIHAVSVSDLTVADLRQSAAACDTYYPAHDIKTLLQKIFTLAAADNPSINKDLPSFIILPAKDEKEQQAFTAEEVQAIYQSYQDGNVFAGYILLMVYTSMMPGEFMKLQRSMFDLDNHQIVGAGIKTKKRKKAAIVYPEWLSPIVRDLLDPDHHADDDPVHPYTYYEKLSKAFKQTLHGCGCRDLTPYACRHTTQTILALDPTTAPAARAAVMRHSIQEEERYTHIEQTYARQAVNQMPSPDELVSRKQKEA